MKAVDPIVEDQRGVPMVDRHRFLLAPAYDSAYASLYRKLFESRWELHPVLRGIARVSTDHCGPIRSVDTPRFEQPMQDYCGIVTLTVRSIEALDFQEQAKQISEVANHFLAEMEKALIGVLSGVANAVGNNFDGKGEPLSLEALRKAALKVEWDFTDDGQVIPKQVLYPSQHASHALQVLKAAARDPELQRIVYTKREKFLAEHPKRRLVKPC